MQPRTGCERAPVFLGVHAGQARWGDAEADAIAMPQHAQLLEHFVAFQRRGGEARIGPQKSGAVGYRPMWRSAPRSCGITCSDAKASRGQGIGARLKYSA